MAPTPAAAQLPEARSRAALSEGDVARMARSRSPAAEVAAATFRLADARARTAGPFPNLDLIWARETVQTGPTSGRGSQDILLASLPIDIARPLTSRALVGAESAWMRAEASMMRSDGVLQALLAYYDLALALRHVGVLERDVANLEEAARVLASRESVGAASGYESARLALARELGRSRLAEAQARADTARARLGALLGLPPESLRVDPSLALMSESDARALAETGGATREAVQHARDAQRLAEQAGDRARWAWVPTLELGAGIKRANDFGAANGLGYALGITLSVPLFDRGQALRAEAEAQRALATARASALLREVGTEVQASFAAFRAALAELQRFESRTHDAVEVLLTAAQGGFREGERTIAELLDAQRAHVEVAERQLVLLGSAKRAEVALRVAAGEIR